GLRIQVNGDDQRVVVPNGFQQLSKAGIRPDTPTHQRIVGTIGHEDYGPAALQSLRAQHPIKGELERVPNVRGPAAFDMLGGLEQSGAVIRERRNNLGHIAKSYDRQAIRRAGSLDEVLGGLANQLALT